MMEKKYVRPIAVLLSVDLFTQVQEYTTEQKISFSAFLRDAIKRKLSQDKIPQEKKEHQFDGFNNW